MFYPAVRTTPGISCEAVPASNVGRRGHEAALRPSNGAAESFVSFIPLFGGAEFGSLVGLECGREREQPRRVRRVTNAGH
jgi:hypothetical protein